MNRIAQENAIAFMKGGNAKVVLHTLKTNKQFMYRIRKKPGSGDMSDAYWVYYDNGKMDHYMGFIKTDILTSRAPSDSEDIRQAQQLFEYLWKKLKTLEVPDRLHIYHMGSCSVCGRPLRDALSLELGVGPECGGRTGRTTKAIFNGQ